jgi:hypothetical protein
MPDSSHYYAADFQERNAWWAEGSTSAPSSDEKSITAAHEIPPKNNAATVITIHLSVCCNANVLRGQVQLP